MRKLAPLLAALAAAALAEEPDPAGTASLRLEAGQSAPVSAAPGANILCDDPSVVAPDFAAEDGAFVLRALRPGSTLCGVWLVGQKPGGLYRVVVIATTDAGPSPDAGRDDGPNALKRDVPADGGAADAGPKRGPSADGGAKDAGG